MRLAVLLAAALQLRLGEVPQDRADAGPVDQEKARIRAKAPLTGDQKAAYVAPEAPPARPRDAYTLSVVPVEFADRKFGETDLKTLVFGGVADYYTRASGGRFKLAGKVADPILLEVERSRFERKDL